MTLANPQEGGKRREEQHIHPTRLVTPEGSADDGKRFPSDGRFISMREPLVKKWEGDLGEGWCRISPDRTLADDGKRFTSDGRFVYMREPLFKNG